MRLTFPTYDPSTGRVALPIADATVSISKPEEATHQAEVVKPGQAYLDCTEKLRQAEADIQRRKDDGSASTLKWMLDKVIHLNV